MSNAKKNNETKCILNRKKKEQTSSFTEKCSSFGWSSI